MSEFSSLSVPIIRDRRSARSSFLGICVAYLMGFLGGQFAIYALPLLVLGDGQVNASEVALLVSVGFLPYLIFGLHVGALVDRSDPAFLLRWSQAIRAVAIAAIPVSLWLFGLSIGVLLILNFVIGALSLVADVAFQASLRFMVAREMRPRVVANIDIARTSIQLSGPVLAGLVITWWSSAGGMLVNSALTCIAAGIAYLFRPGGDPGRNLTIRLRGRADSGIHLDVVNGLRFVGRHRVLVALLAAFGIWAVGIGMYQAISLVLFSSVLELSPSQIGIVFGISNAGFLGGSVAFRFLVRPARPRFAIVLGYMLSSIGLLGLFILLDRANVVGLGLLMFVSSLGSPLIGAGFTTLRQRLSPPLMIGRVSSLSQIAGRGASPLGGFAAAVIVAAASPESIPLIAALLGLIAAGIAGTVCWPVRRSKKDGVSPWN